MPTTPSACSSTCCAASLPPSGSSSAGSGRSRGTIPSAPRSLLPMMAKRLEAFGCIIHYNSRKPKESVSYKFFPSVHGLASESDVLVVACALSKETRHIVNKDVLDALGKDRGLNVDEVELVSALAERRIAGAGLDVYEKEPKVPAELLAMDNVVPTHHCSAFTKDRQP